MYLWERVRLDKDKTRVWSLPSIPLLAVTNVDVKAKCFWASTPLNQNNLHQAYSHLNACKKE